MSLVSWQPLKELNTLRHRMNQLLDELMHTDHENSPISKLENRMWTPAIELRETDTALILKAAVPGIEAKELDIHASENAVSIAGEHREEKHTEEKGYFHSELHYGQFQRTVPLPVSVKPDQAQAECNDGLLTLTLPKATQQSMTKINLTTQERARESIVQHRQHEEHLQETMRNRATADLKAPSNTDTQAEARELMVKQRQHEEHLQETMHQRAANDISTSN
jgi:HSP20 family protein